MKHRLIWLHAQHWDTRNAHVVYYYQWRLYYALPKTYSFLVGYRMTVKSLPADLFHQVICQGEIFKWETLFCDTMYILLLYGQNGRSALEIRVTFLQISHKPNINFEHDCIFGKPMKCRFQRYLVCTEILSTFPVRIEYISVQKYVILPIQSNGSANAEKSPKQPLPLEAPGPHLIHECLG